MTDVTRIIAEIENGNPNAAERLLPIVYQELRQVAAAKLAGKTRTDIASDCAGA